MMWMEGTPFPVLTCIVVSLCLKYVLLVDVEKLALSIYYTIKTQFPYPNQRSLTKAYDNIISKAIHIYTYQQLI